MEMYKGDALYISLYQGAFLVQIDNNLIYFLFACSSLILYIPDETSSSNADVVGQSKLANLGVEKSLFYAH